MTRIGHVGLVGYDRVRHDVLSRQKRKVAAVAGVGLYQEAISLKLYEVFRL